MRGGRPQDRLAWIGVRMPGVAVAVSPRHRPGIKTPLAMHVTNLLLRIAVCVLCSLRSHVAGPGLEPGVAGYEPAVLPLHYPAILLAALAWGRTGDVAHTLPHYI